MKRNVRFCANNHTTIRLFAGFLFLLVIGMNRTNAEVHFTQTTTADFNKGVLNNVVVASDNIYLQFHANNVGTWLTTTVLPQTLSGHKMVSWNDRYVFLVGGYNGLTYSTGVYKATVQTGGITSWTAQNSLPVSLKDPAVVVGTNTIYVLGGRDDSQVVNTIYYASIASDGTLGAWQTSAVTLPVNLWGHTAVYMNGYIYVAGGASSLTETDAINTVYYTQVSATNTLSAFSTGTVLPATRNKHSMVTYNSKLYVLGGYANGGTKASTVYSATPGLDGSTGAWTTETALPLAISNHSSVVTNGLIMVLAGENNTTLSNVVYYADADAGALTWVTSPNVMYDYVKDGSAFTGNGQVYAAGGTNLSAEPIHNCRYSNLALSANYVNHGVFVSNPYFELGAERVIDSLIFNSTYNATFANCQISYRTAPSSGVWGNWTALTNTSPIIVGQTKQYLQYKVVLTGQTTYNATFQDMTLTTPGTQLAGNLNTITTFTQALSPYWATSDISFSAGTHTFEAGAVILFLPGTGLTVGQANVVCNGTVTDSVKFLYYTAEAGLWDGIYFDPNSDNGVSSQFYYTVIANAGFGTNNANLYCNQSNEPLLSHCSLRAANGNGLSLNSAHVNLYNCSLRGNSENGAYLVNSNPTFGTCALSYNLGAGVFLSSSASVPTYSSTTIDHNLYGFRYPSPNDTFYEPDGLPTLTANTYNGIAIDGGDITGSNRTWNSISYDYILLGSVKIVQWGSSIRLTIEPGNTVKSTAGVQIQVGRSCCEGGELYALGTTDSLITFTSWNGAAGGWDGIWFTDQSDSYGGHSQLDYCVIENGNDYNYFSQSTIQPDVINHSKIRNALVDGARYESGTGTIMNCEFQNNGRYPIYCMNPQANPILLSNTYLGKGINRIALSGGDYSDRTIRYDGTPYYVLTSMFIVGWGSHPRMTIQPGVTLEFAAGTKLQVGRPCCEGGEIYAVGKADSLITFKAYNNVVGGWEGIYYPDQSDTYGSISTMTYCVIKQGASYNLKCESTANPTLDHCLISHSALDGIVETSSSAQIHNCQFLNNNGYPLRYMDWQCNSHLQGNTYTGNNPNYIALSGGEYTSARTLYNDGIPYHVLGDILIVAWGNTVRLTIRPSVTLEFDPGKKLQLGRSCCEGGEIYAVGKADSLITFKAYTNVAGGWNGIFFTDQNDTYGGVSTMGYCVVKQGNTYNLLCESSAQPSINYCTFSHSQGDGLKLVNSSLNIRNSTFNDNPIYGINLEGNSNPTIGNTTAYTCNFYNNGLYDLYQNGTSNINARYNYWGSGDSAMIAARIFDYYDNVAKGKVYFNPFAQVPSLPSATTTMNGTLTYNNPAANPMQNSVMTIKDFAGTTIATTTANTSGVYAFAPFTSGNYQLFITPAAPWGGVNATDALDILNHFAHIDLLSGMELAAADVNLSATVNASDALYVMKRYSGMITSFPAGNYLYHSDTLIFAGSLVTNNMKMLCFGDVNSSYGPTLKNDSRVILEYNGEIPVYPFAEFDLPVKIRTGVETGAISLGFYYPEEYLEVLGAELHDGNPDLVFDAQDGLLRMAWCNLDPISFGNEDIVVTLKLKAKSLETLPGNIALVLYEDCEFANRFAHPYEGIVITVPQIQGIIGIDEEMNPIGVSVYPNPSRSITRINLSLPEQSHVKISLINQLGTTVRTITDENYSAGFHRLEMRTDDLSEGIYFLNITSVSDSYSWLKTIKLVVTK